MLDEVANCLLNPAKDLLRQSTAAVKGAADDIISSGLSALEGLNTKINDTADALTAAVPEYLPKPNLAVDLLDLQAQVELKVENIDEVIDNFLSKWGGVSGIQSIIDNILNIDICDYVQFDGIEQEDGSYAIVQKAPAPISSSDDFVAEDFAPLIASDSRNNSIEISAPTPEGIDSNTITGLQIDELRDKYNGIIRRIRLDFFDKDYSNEEALYETVIQKPNAQYVIEKANQIGENNLLPEESALYNAIQKASSNVKKKALSEFAYAETLTIWEVIIKKYAGHSEIERIEFIHPEYWGRINIPEQFEDGTKYNEEDIQFFEIECVRAFKIFKSAFLDERDLVTDLVKYKWSTGQSIEPSQHNDKIETEVKEAKNIGLGNPPNNPRSYVGGGTFNSSRALSIASSDNARSGYCARGVKNILLDQNLGDFSGLNAHDFPSRMSREGYIKVKGAAPSNAPEGAILTFNSDVRQGNRPRNSGGGLYGHVEVVASSSGNRVYVSDKARTNFGGSVPDNFTGAWVRKPKLEDIDNALAENDRVFKPGEYVNDPYGASALTLPVYNEGDERLISYTVLPPKS